MKTPLFLMLAMLAVTLSARTRVIELPGSSPLVTFRIVFTTGSAADPAEKPGLAYLTAMMLANGGSRDMTYQQIVDAMFPMASSLHAQVDKEMTTFSQVSTNRRASQPHDQELPRVTIIRRQVKIAKIPPRRPALV